ncbi:hypothetical protein CHLNCDRAFT_135865 [Chlorella variabilis]|uniref:Uncharacterized protein n=1 Tax=Chlorella variabilis TaxID=554065 RepID=E1ZJ64_CHLVA|nr:hypothetical protein CHLNCDRAFT_135865 [Chlorella variabilis]EFN54446.1 hypothetical protein CHLNCDRAFT_135865 [Chlorella variabilis]|eukprot:XP_005846548.1 hypothetical protein CHLNCDRAFT_135865 [Chlorella variabilis]
MSKLDAASEEEVAEWRRRAQQLASELQRVRAQQEEYQRLRLQYDKLEADLQQASTAASRLAQENCELKSLGGAPVDSALGGADPLAAQQVAKQMEALLQEKSKLAQENDRLLRENSGLQELLEFTLQHHAQLAGDNELFGYDEGEEAGEVVLPSPMDQSPPASEAGADEGTGVSTGAATLAAVPASA